MQKNEGQAPIERVVTERRSLKKKKKGPGRSEETRYHLSVPQSRACKESAERWPNSPLKVMRRRRHHASSRKLVRVRGEIN